MAFMSGLKTAGIMDHDSVGGNFEFIEAGKIINMATTVGMECRLICQRPNYLINALIIPIKGDCVCSTHMEYPILSWIQ